MPVWALRPSPPGRHTATMARARTGSRRTTHVRRAHAFHWEDFGWHVARLGATTAADANVSGLYDGRWREHHALFLADYGMRGPGSWILLSPARPASPLLDYAAGKYKKQRGGDVWLRADQLLHHTGAELEAARDAAKHCAAFEAGRCDSTACTLGAGHDGCARIYAQRVSADAAPEHNLSTPDMQDG